MRLAIHQPNFLPRLKVLQKLASADEWIILDNVQFARREWQNRAKIFPANAKHKPFWLTLPVHLADGRGTLIKDVRVQDLMKTIDRCGRSLRHAFRSTDHWAVVADYWGEVEETLGSDGLVDISLATVVVALRRFARVPKTKLASELDLDGRKSRLIANICELLGATEYLSDTGARAYLQQGDFASTNVLWQAWQAPEIAGCQNDWTDLSFINFLARYGAAELRDHLLSGFFECDDERCSRVGDPDS